MTSGNTDNHSLSLEDALDGVQDSWDQLIVGMSTAPESEYIGKTDAAGWTPVDHLAHVTAWERSRRFWLMGRPRHEGLGVTQEEFELGIDELNEIVRAKTHGRSYQQTLTDSHLGHEQLLDALLSVDAAVLAASDGIRTDGVGAQVKENLADHYDEHRRYIEQILATNALSER